MKLSWGVPTELGNQLASKLLYRVQYCSGSVCKNATTTPTLEVPLFNLSLATNYTYTIYAINEANLEGLGASGNFTTPKSRM